MNFNFDSSHKPKAINPDKIVDYHSNLSSWQSSDDLILTSFKFVNYMFKYKKLNETLLNKVEKNCVENLEIVFNNLYLVQYSWSDYNT